MEENEIRPRIRHSTVVSDVRVIGRIAERFSQQMVEKAGRMLKDEVLKQAGIDWNDASPENLLRLRKKTVEYVRTGMLERNDCELEIGLFAMLTWYNRLEQTRKNEILDAW